MHNIVALVLFVANIGLRLVDNRLQHSNIDHTVAGNHSTSVVVGIGYTMAQCRFLFRSLAHTPRLLVNVLCNVWPSCTHKLLNRIVYFIFFTII